MGFGFAAERPEHSHRIRINVGQGRQSVVVARDFTARSSAHGYSRLERAADTRGRPAGSSFRSRVGLGFGLDWTRYHAYVPLVLQWNFWLTERWSVFAEPGVAIHWTEERFRRARPDFTVYGGARVRLADRVALTFRAGYPAISLGVSFLL